MILLAALVLLDKSDDSQDKMEEILKQTAEKIESVVNSINVERKNNKFLKKRNQEKMLFN